VANNTAKDLTYSAWTSFKIPSGSTSDEMRRSVAQNLSKVVQERKIFEQSSLINGGVKVLVK
jgi:hypothetical protein